MDALYQFVSLVRALAVLLFFFSCKGPAVEAAVPADPVGLVAEQLSSSSARLSWTPASDAASYYVFARGEGDAYYVSPAATLPAGSSTYTFTGLKPGTGYYFGVQALGKEGKTLSKISYSEQIKLIDYENLPKVTVSSCEPGLGSVSVRYHWEKVPEEAPEHGLCLRAGGDPTVQDICLPGPAIPASGDLYQVVSNAVWEAGKDYRLCAYVRSDGEYWYSEPQPLRMQEVTEPVTLDWKPVAVEGLPAAIQVYETVSPLKGRAFHAWYAVADCTGDVEFRVQNPSARATLDAQAGSDCYVLINGGIYGTKHIGVIIADGVKQAWRDEVDGSYWGYDEKLYPVARAAFGVDAAGKPACYWVSAPSATELYWYDRPLPTVMGESLYGPASATFPGPAVTWNPVQALSTGPMLLYGGRIVVDREKSPQGYYRTNFEAWAEDIFPTHPDRTAVGCTADGKVVLFICDGRITTSDGAYVEEVAQILKDLGCVSAINLDGGGSTGMVVCGRHLNDLTGGNRAVLSTLGFFRKR
ncbi:MAG: phosphodiester glycosidase family protein [Bacteroidales bacterium]|nr:phosphodiester glycosidase family protein [Bacteroidales bacterium]